MGASMSSSERPDATSDRPLGTSHVADLDPPAPIAPSAPGSDGDLAERRNDQYGWIDRYASDLLAASRDMVANGEQGRVNDETVAQLMTAALRLYAAKTDGEERTFRPLAGEGDAEMTATELLTGVSELLRAMHLSPMELSIWFRHRPDEE